ncbi:P-loop containing nucleoside triphosphate hydrolase protein, partial [Armillaria gallica]
SKSDLDDHAIHLSFSAYQWELASTVEDFLESGVTVLFDRYAFSGIASSASKGLPYDWCRPPDAGLPAPDLVVFLDITPEKRGSVESTWAPIDAGREREQVAADIWTYVEPLVDGIDHAIGKLWV